MNEYSNTLLDKMNMIYRMEINPVHPVNPAQNEYSDFFGLLGISTESMRASKSSHIIIILSTAFSS